VAGEYWYYEAKNWKKSYDLEFIKGAKKDNQIMELQTQFGLQVTKTEESKATLWQQPYMIVGYVVVAFAAGIFLGVQ
jgi:hypothetical protein